MRRYAGVSEDELRKIMIDQVSRSLFRGLHYEAVERIEEHRAAGHRTLLLTGEIDVFVEPLAPLFDVFVAGQMEKDERGRWTGHLATSPLIGEARAAWLCRYAEDEGMDLSASYAYGDSYSDRSWLDVVGHPNAVNPDADLYRYAKMHRWPVHTWKTTAENRLTRYCAASNGKASCEHAITADVPTIGGPWPPGADHRWQFRSGVRIRSCPGLPGMPAGPCGAERRSAHRVRERASGPVPGRRGDHGGGPGRLRQR